mmetsp:Transcript_141586/g.440151  ORF Transcript_141586/g.440151 Transcript_141586/m.440151 type:complete len:212 (-) Transcript_141586:1254-1889(-)
MPKRRSQARRRGSLRRVRSRQRSRRPRRAEGRPSRERPLPQSWWRPAHAAGDPRPTPCYSTRATPCRMRRHSLEPASMQECSRHAGTQARRHPGTHARGSVEGRAESERRCSLRLRPQKANALQNRWPSPPEPSRHRPQMSTSKRSSWASRSLGMHEPSVAQHFGQPGDSFTPSKGMPGFHTPGPPSGPSAPRHWYCGMAPKLKPFSGFQQ